MALRTDAGSAGRGLLRAALVSLVLTVVWPLATAGATPPGVLIASPFTGAVITSQTPPFSGQGEEGHELRLAIYSGPTVQGRPVEEAEPTFVAPGGAWTAYLFERLGDGTYTAVAAETNVSGETGFSPSVTFTINTGAPTVALNYPGSPPYDTTPSFTGSASDTTPVTVLIHAGATSRGTIVSAASATGTGGAWTSGNAAPALGVGQYTAVAIQPSSLRNPPGRSGPVTFTVTAPPPPPVALFRWFPSVPQTGEQVSLVSNSTDAASPITATAWALSSDGPFAPGGAVLNTSFATPGGHVVRLLVTDANGFSNTATETIPVISPRVLLMQPFPVVRIAGTETRSGIRLRLLRVQQTPGGAKVLIRCRGRGCPIKSQRRFAVASPRGVGPVDFRTFERVLRAGVTLEILISKPGSIGKYTRFTVRRHRLPIRVDSCLDPLGVSPQVCPPS
jgi:hypothetical protein